MDIGQLVGPKPINSTISGRVFAGGKPIRSMVKSRTCDVDSLDRPPAGYIRITREQLQDRIIRFMSPRGAKAALARELKINRQAVTQIARGDYLPGDAIASMVSVKIARGPLPRFYLCLDAMARQPPMVMPAKPTKQMKKEQLLRDAGYVRFTDEQVRQQLVEKSAGMLIRELGSAIGTNLRTASDYRVGRKPPSIKVAKWLGLEVLWTTGFNPGRPPKRRFTLWGKAQ